MEVKKFTLVVTILKEKKYTPLKSIASSFRSESKIMYCSGRVSLNKKCETDFKMNISAVSRLKSKTKSIFSF